MPSSEEAVHDVAEPSVGKGLMRMSWHDLLFMHWPVDAEQLRQHLPDSLTLDTFEGQAWIGIVPFRMSDVSLTGVPALPWLSKFPELNVRTYVIGPDGRRGVWFYSLDATNPIAVRGARWLYCLNYVDAAIKCAEDDSSNGDRWIHYDSRRTHRNQPAAKLRVDYRPTGPAFEARPGTLVRWLTSRYTLFSASKSGRLFRGDISHPPWQLCDAEAVTHENTMTEGIGVVLPATEPLLHFARTTKVRASAIRRVS